MNQIELYISKIGKIVVNLLSLEFSLRAFLHEYNKSTEPIFYIKNCVTGMKVPENSFTNYDTLGMLVKKFNKISRYYSIDEIVIDVRDMIAHGRVSSDKIRGPMSLLKFSKPDKNKMVKVTHMVELNEQWLNEKIRLIKNQVENVINESIKLGYKIFPDFI